MSHNNIHFFINKNKVTENFLFGRVGKIAHFQIFVIFKFTFKINEKIYKNSATFMEFKINNKL